VLIVVGKIKDISHSPVGVGCSDGPISPFMLMYAVLAEAGGGDTDGPDFCQRVFEEVVFLAVHVGINCFLSLYLISTKFPMSAAKYIDLYKSIFIYFPFNFSFFLSPTLFLISLRIYLFFFRFLLLPLSHSVPHFLSVSSLVFPSFLLKFSLFIISNRAVRRKRYRF
jgi:hypothetical protein